MEKPLISIIVPVYNAENYIIQCIDSLINQTYNNIEIILIDDGSTDKSAQIITEYLRQESRIKFFQQSNKGPSAARNFGIQECKGKYLAFLDSDDWLDLNTFEELVSKLSEDDFDVVFCSYVREYRTVSLPKDVLLEDQYFNEVGSKSLFLRLFGLTDKELKNPENADSIVPVWMKLYKTNIIKDNSIKFVDTKIIGSAEDALFNIYYFHKINKAYYFHRHFYHYRRDNLSSYTSAYRPNLVIQWDNLFAHINEAIVNFSLDSSFVKALKNRIALGIIGLGLNEMASDKRSSDKIITIRTILNKKNYKEAISQLNLKYFPLKWKMFFLAAKMNSAIGLYIFLSIINYIINRNRKMSK